MRREVRRSATAAIRRAKVALMAITVLAAVVLVAVGSWPLKILVVLAFVRGLFASDLVALRNAPRRRSSKENRSPASSGAPKVRGVTRRSHPPPRVTDGVSVAAT